MPDGESIRKECQIRGVSFEILSDGQANAILDEISSPSKNQDAVILEKSPKIARGKLLVCLRVHRVGGRDVEHN